MSFKIAVIGCGGIALKSHGPSYQRYATTHSDVVLAACCDIDLQRAEQFRAQFGFKRSYTNFMEMLDGEHPSAVCLNVSEKFACEIGCQVMRHGYPLLAEKPPGVTTVEVDRLIDTSRVTGVINQVAFNRRFNPLVKELKHRLAGAPIHHIDHQLFRVGRTDPDFTRTAIHAVDTVRYLAGCDYRQIAFQYQDFVVGQPPAVVTNYFLEGSFPSGTIASLSIAPVTGLSVERTLIHTSDCTFVLKMNLGPDAPGSLQQYENGQLVLDINAAEFSHSSDDSVISGFAAEDAAFFETVRSQRPSEHDFASARQSVEIMQVMHERRSVWLGEV